MKPSRAGTPSDGKQGARIDEDRISERMYDIYLVPEVERMKRDNAWLLRFVVDLINENGEMAREDDRLRHENHDMKLEIRDLKWKLAQMARDEDWSWMNG